MSRIAECFRRLRSEQRRALIPFITAGDPTPEASVPLMHALVAAGADVVELGVPFSDPMADGPVIQRASERALAHGTTLRKVLALVQEFRMRDGQTPVVLMGYLNPFEAMGYDAFAHAAEVAGVDGVLTVDMPPEEAEVFVQALQRHGLDPIFLLAPTSDAGRIARICASASGFVYYVSLKGVTGASNLDVEAVREKLASIRAVTDLPVGVGFGIRDAESAARIAAVSDAVVVGSALVQRIAELAGDPGEMTGQASALLRSMREAMDAATAGGAIP